MKLGLIQAIDLQHRAAAWDIPPFSLAYIASYLEKYLEFKEVFIAETWKELQEYKPDIVGISAYSQYFKLAEDIAIKVKQSLQVPVIIGGCHISALPHQLPSCFDVGVIGEGEETFLELISTFIREKALSAESLANIKGIVFHHKGKRIITESRAHIEPLDRLPFFKRELLRWQGPQDFSFTSRGCPYKCIFCSPTVIWKGYRCHSPEYVINEIKEIVRSRRVECWDFADDLFIADFPRLQKIADLIVAEGLHKKLTFGCTIRANLVNEEVCQILKKMNVVSANFGAEAVSEHLLKYYRKGISREDIQKTLDLCHKYNIRVKASFIILSPNEKLEDLLEMCRFVIKNRHKCYQFAFLPLIPLPGTAIWQFALEKGLVSEGSDMDWELLDGYFNSTKGINLNNTITRKDMIILIQELNKLMKEEGLDWYETIHSSNPYEVNLIMSLCKLLDFIIKIYFPEKVNPFSPG